MTAPNVMIDIETLSLKPNAAVISIGVAAFSIEEGVTDSSEWKLKLSNVYGHIDPDTVDWWMHQSDAAREDTFGGTLRHSPFSAATGLRDFLAAHGGKDALIWANSPSFDLVILRNWWENMPAGRAHPTIGDTPWPVSYRNERDFRTLVNLALDLDIDVSDCWLDTAHSAVGDACNQARAVAKIMRHLKGAP